MSTIVGQFALSPREKEKGDRRDSRRDEREGQGRERNRNESEETEEIKTFPLYPYLLQGQQALPNCKPISVGDTFAPLDYPLTDQDERFLPFTYKFLDNQQLVKETYSKFRTSMVTSNGVSIFRMKYGIL